MRQVALIRRKTFRHAKNHQSLVVGAGCIHGGKRVKSQTCALLKFLTIRKARSRHTTTKGICIYLRDDEDFVREEKSRKRGAASRDLVNRRPKGRDTRSKTHCARTKVRPCQYGADTRVCSHTRRPKVEVLARLADGARYNVKHAPGSHASGKRFRPGGLGPHFGSF